MGWKPGCLIVALLAAFSAPLARADDFMSLEQSIALGRFTLELRPRYNEITESEYPLKTEGGTIRMVAGYRTGAWRGWRANVELIHTDRIGPQHFNDNGADFGTSPYPLLPDPSYTGPNQVNIEYAGDGGLRLKLGRQLVRFGNQRWVSDNDFRQVPQVFDGVRAWYDGFERTQLEGGYFTRVRTTSGITNDLKLGLVRAAWNPLPDHVLGAYAVFHDQPQNGAFTGFANNSYRIVGARAEGAFPLSRYAAALQVPYLLEIAHQDPYAGGDARIDARYWRAGLGLSTPAWTVRYDEELRGSNQGQYGLQAPLTDFYAFNGWTLNFYNAPRTGLHDRWLTARLAIDRVTLYGEAHQFRSDHGDADLGRELDVGVTVDLWRDIVVRLQHARYDAPPATVGDIRKTWLTFSWTY